MDHEKLKPCPFCGGEAAIGDGGYSGEKFFVRCRELSCPAASGTVRKTHNEAVAAWNQRKYARTGEEEEMSNNTCKYTDLKIRKVEAEIENWENNGFIEKVYYEIVDEEGNVYFEADELHQLI